MERVMDCEGAGAANPFGVMSCYRAWSHWCARLDGGGYQVRHVSARVDRLKADKAVEVLCEVYARAVFEVSLAMCFDNCDSRVDHEVLLQIADSFGRPVAERVYERVASVGPVVQRVLPGGLTERASPEEVKREALSDVRSLVEVP